MGAPDLFALADAVRVLPEVTSLQLFAGAPAPFNFNGLVRHYFMRRGGNVADVQVNLLPKGERKRQSHAIAVAVRPAVDSIAKRYGASAKVAEIPPGPPVLSTLVAEVYAADDSARMAAALAVKQVFERPQHDYTKTLLAAEPKGRPATDPLIVHVLSARDVAAILDEVLAS